MELQSGAEIQIYRLNPPGSAVLMKVLQNLGRKTTEHFSQLLNLLTLFIMQTQRNIEINTDC